MSRMRMPRLVGRSDLPSVTQHLIPSPTKHSESGCFQRNIWNGQIQLLRPTKQIGGGRRNAGSRIIYTRNLTRQKGHLDRKSTRLNSSHVAISYAVFCFKTKK